MGKTYIDTVKYIVYAQLEIGGLVEKPDVVGAIFGQTEGLLGDDLDLRDLQKNGRIGRIEVDLNPRGGKSIGKIKLPSSLDMVETCILAASLETVDRVGPCEASIKVEKIEDTRNLKRKGLVDRAKYLLKNMLTAEIPESKEISEQVRSEVKTAEICEYGPDKLPAGPTVASMDAVILVEGRADVLNLLKNDITNVVAVGGAKVAPSIARLCREKEVTVFLDGDRGGEIILAEISRIGDIDFLSRAPDGKEVEELTRKEIIKCLRSKVPFEQGVNGNGSSSSHNNSNHDDRRNSRYGGSRYSQNDRYSRNSTNQHSSYRSQSSTGYTGRQAQQSRFSPREQTRQQAPAPQQDRKNYQPRVFEPGKDQNNTQQATPPTQQQQSQPQQSSSPAPTTVPEPILAAMGELENTLKARFFDENLKMVKEVPVRDMIKTLDSVPSVYAIAFDGIITQRLADLSENKKAKVLAGLKLGNVFKKPQGILLHTKQ